MREANPRQIRAEVAARAARAAHGTRQAIPVFATPPPPRQHLPLRTLVREIAGRGRFSMNQIAGALGVSVGDPNRFLDVVGEVVQIPGYRPVSNSGDKVYFTQRTR